MDDPIGVLGDILFVRDQHDRFAMASVESLECMEDDFAGPRVEVAGRLVGQDKRRIVDERTRCIIPPESWFE